MLDDHRQESPIGSPQLRIKADTKPPHYAPPKAVSKTVDEFDEFDLEASKCTPLLERVKKRAAKK